MFQKIDRSTWKREEYFNHYLSAVPCTYSMTVRLDITGLREKKLNLYPTMLYMLATVVNGHEEFRTALDSHGNVGIYDTLILATQYLTKKVKSFRIFGLHTTRTMNRFVQNMKRTFKNMALKRV